MKKRKNPALTSPWKIGFLVSLLLVLTSIGVNIMIMRTFRLSWSWLSVEQGSWAFHRDRFIEQIGPQLALLIVLCLAAYFAVTSAVRKYKAYLDSGRDYRNLIASLKGVADLDNEAALKKLDAYPELKNLLADMRSKISERDKAVEQKMRELEERTNGGGQERRIAEECTRLVEAIRERIASEGRSDWNPILAHPHLNAVSEAISRIPFAGKTRCCGEERERMAGLHRELQEAGAFMRARLEGISGELALAGREAENIEVQINALREAIEQDESPQRAGEAAAMAEQLAGGVSNMLRFSESLQDLGEDTKSLAIGTALQAGAGNGTVADLIGLAEGVKEIAEKYEQYAAS
ncbi:MAG: hypothetical protein HY770_04895, partial [Chitinivibrionia bacterium]|nr:hypothetical protein [Chitinivibrionia bacterium]